MEEKPSSKDVPHISVIFQQSLVLYKQKVWTLVGTQVFPALISLSFAFYELWYKSHPDKNTFNIETTGILFVIALIALVVGITSQGALLYAIIEDNTVVQAYRKAWKKALSLFWVNILAGLLIAAGFLMLVIPGIYLLVTYVFSSTVLFTENKTGMNALSASAAYVKGKWWYVFGIVITISILTHGIDYTLEVLPTIFPMSSDILSQLVALFTWPFFTITTYVLYLHCKSAKK